MVRNIFKTKFAKTTFTLFNCGCIAHCVSEYLCSLLIVSIQIHFKNFSIQLYALMFILQCSGPSMEPTLHSNDVIVTENISSRLHRYNYGDIVVFRSSRNQKELVCKRIIALPGDRIYFQDKRHVSKISILRL